jgi:hypothetical protein
MQHGIVTDGDHDGPNDCTWTIAPPGATMLFLTFTKLSLGGTVGNDEEQLEIVSCESIKCSSPQNIPKSPFSQRSPTLPWFRLMLK